MLSFSLHFIVVGGAACVQAAATYSSDEETYASTMARTDQTGEASQRMAEAGAAPQTKVRPVQCAGQAESLSSAPRLSPLHVGAITGLLTLPPQGRCISAVSGRLIHAVSTALRGELHWIVLSQVAWLMLFLQVDPAEWRLELERVAPRLRITMPLDAKDWRLHLEQAHQHSEQIGKLWPDGQTALQKVLTEVCGERSGMQPCWAG